MNLAEIRKKANLDRDDAAASQLKTWPLLSESSELIEGHLEEQKAEHYPLSMDRDNENALYLPPELDTGQKPVQPIKPEVLHEYPFDPLEILLAGRLSSGYADLPDISSDDEPGPEILDYQEFLCFRVCAEQYAINILEIKEIIRPREITEVPRSPVFISGVLSLRGMIIPVFNMALRLHLEPEGTGSKERIIVVSKGEELCGIQVDEVIRVVKIPASGIEQRPVVLEGIDRDFVEGIGHHSSGMLILLNLRSILDVTLC